MYSSTGPRHIVPLHHGIVIGIIRQRCNPPSSRAGAPTVPPRHQRHSLRPQHDTASGPQNRLMFTSESLDSSGRVHPCEKPVKLSSALAILTTFDVYGV